MTPQEFIALHFTKTAAKSRYEIGMNALGSMFGPNSAVRRFGQRAQQAGQNIYEEAATAPGMQRFWRPPVEAAKFVGQELGNLGIATRRGMRNTLNYADDVYRGAQRDPSGQQMFDFMQPRGPRLGDRMYRGQHRGFNWLSPSGTPGSSSFNPGNIAVGAGTAALGYKGTKALGSAMFGGSDPDAIKQQANHANNMQRAMAVQMGRPGYGQPQQQGGFLSGMPTEMRYALAAGVPLMLAGGLMGGRGGAGLGALGLGAAGLGAAGAGYFGDGPRRMVGQGVNSLYGAFGGNQNPMGQIQALSRLSPEFGTTALMGRLPGVDSTQARGMYDMLTQNQNLIEPLLQQLQGSSVGPMQKQFSDNRSLQKIGADIATRMKQSRCWEGYEPVPGAKAYSRGSCRPVNSKKTQKEMKAGNKTSK